MFKDNRKGSGLVCVVCCSPGTPCPLEEKERGEVSKWSDGFLMAIPRHSKTPANRIFVVCQLHAFPGLVRNRAASLPVLISVCAPPLPKNCRTTAVRLIEDVSAVSAKNVH